MQLKDYTTHIKHYCNSTKSSFFKVCALLSEIKKTDKYKEKYNTFEEYIQKEDFEFKLRNAYNYIKIWDTFGNNLLPSDSNVHLLHKVSITELLQISNIPDREVREDLVESAVKGEITKEQITEAKTLKVKDKPRINTEEERKFKLLREFPNLKSEYQRVIEQIKIWIQKAEEFKELESKRAELSEFTQKE